MKLSPQTWAVIGAITVVSVAAAYLAHKASQAGAGLVDAAGQVGAAINPLSDQNVFYKAASAVGDVLSGASGTESRPLGVRLFEVLNPATVAAENAGMNGPAPVYEDAVSRAMRQQPFAPLTDAAGIPYDAYTN